MFSTGKKQKKIKLKEEMKALKDLDLKKDSDIAKLRAENAAINNKNAALKDENASLKDENSSLKDENASWKDEYACLKAFSASSVEANTELLQKIEAMQDAFTTQLEELEHQCQVYQKELVEEEKINLALHSGLNMFNPGTTLQRCSLKKSFGRNSARSSSRRSQINKVLELKSNVKAERLSGEVQRGKEKLREMERELSEFKAALAHKEIELKKCTEEKSELVIAFNRTARMESKVNEHDNRLKELEYQSLQVPVQSEDGEDAENEEMDIHYV